MSIDSVFGSDSACVLNSTFACRSLATALSTYTKSFTRYVLYPGVHLTPLTGMSFAADRMQLMGAAKPFASSIVDCQQRSCFNLTNGYVPVVLLSLQFRSAVGGILSLTGFATLAYVVSLVAGGTVPDFQQASRAVTALGQSIQRGASAVDIAVSRFQILIDKCDFSQSQASGSGNSTLLSLTATSNVLIRDCVFRSANVTSGDGIYCFCTVLKSNVKLFSNVFYLLGVVLLSNVNNVAIVRSLFVGNVASSGAAVALSNSQGLVYLVNSTFRENLGGSAVSAVSSTLVIVCQSYYLNILCFL